ncbi:MAG: IS1595 family transposase [Actinomycetota bacterium]|nr:IS1595 family transposase [Actinomycetota bacterium]
MEMNLADLVEQFGSNDRCRDYLEHLRWPNGVECPKCGSQSISRIKTRKQFDCNSCRKRFSVLAGTIFQDSKLPLWKWFSAVYLLCESKKGVSALQVKRMLKIGSYETAWYLCHRIRRAMVETDPELLRGIVEIDETFIGGKPRYHFDGQQGYRGNKTMIVGAIQRGGKLRVKATSHPYATQKMAEGFIAATVAGDAKAIYTDDAHAYHRLGDEDTVHETVNHSKDEWVRGQIHTNTVESAWSLFDRAVMGSYHKLSVKHLPAYLAEFEFRFNNRENPHLFRDTILKLIEADVLTYEALTAA